jgi:hypothetical protein
MFVIVCVVLLFLLTNQVTHIMIKLLSLNAFMLTAPTVRQQLQHKRQSDTRHSRKINVALNFINSDMCPSTQVRQHQRVTSLKERRM